MHTRVTLDEQYFCLEKGLALGNGNDTTQIIKSQVEGTSSASFFLLGPFFVRDGVVVMPADGNGSSGHLGQNHTVSIFSTQLSAFDIEIARKKCFGPF